MIDAGPAVLSIGVLASAALAFGGARLLRRPGERTKAVLMLVAAAVLLANVLLWAWPMPGDGVPVLAPSSHSPGG